MAGLEDINPLANLNTGDMSTFALILLVCVMTGVILIFVGLIIFYFTMKKQFWINIHVFKMVGNNPTRIAIYKAKDINIGRAGDKLWRVAPKGFSMAFKVLKWLPVGKFQTARNEFWYWIRSDGEWINFTIADIDDLSKQMKVNFVQEDMRLQRLATEKILEQRLLTKTFWEKYGGLIVNVMYFLIIAVCMVIIFYQFSEVASIVGGIVTKADEILQHAVPQSLIPVG